jgi:hypothetical protein
MATTVARPNSAPTVASAVALQTAQTSTGDGDTADRRALSGPADLVVTYTDTGANTVTFDIQGSADNVNWWNVPYALIATPSTYVIAAVTYNTNGGGTVHYLLQSGMPWRYLRQHITANTATTVDSSVYFYAP